MMKIMKIMMKIMKILLLSYYIRAMNWSLSAFFFFNAFYNSTNFSLAPE